MLMQAVWWLVATPVGWVLDYLPEPPDPLDISVPFPAWLPSWPLTVGLAAVLLAAALGLLVRFARWVYGLVPVIQ